MILQKAIFSVLQTCTIYFSSSRRLPLMQTVVFEDSTTISLSCFTLSFMPCLSTGASPLLSWRERDVRKPPSCYICMVDILASNLPRDNVSARSNTSRVNCWRSHASRIFLFFPSICCLDFRTFIKASERTLASF